MTMNPASEVSTDFPRRSAILAPEPIFPDYMLDDPDDSRSERKRKREMRAAIGNQVAANRRKNEIVRRRKNLLKRREQGYVITSKHWGSKPRNKYLRKVA